MGDTSDPENLKRMSLAAAEIQNELTLRAEVERAKSQQAREAEQAAREEARVARERELAERNARLLQAERERSERQKAAEAERRAARAAAEADRLAAMSAPRRALATHKGMVKGALTAVVLLAVLAGVFAGVSWLRRPAGIRLDGSALGLALSNDDSTIFAAIPNAVAIIDASSGQQTGSIEAPGQPSALAISPDGGALYIGDSKSGTITRYNLNSQFVESTFAIPVPNGSPTGMATTHDGTKLAVVINDYSGSGLVSKLWTMNLDGSGAQPVFEGCVLQGVAISRDDSFAYVTDYCDGVHKVSLQSAADTRLYQMESPQGVALSEDGFLMFVTSLTQNTVTEVETVSGYVVDKWPVIEGPAAIAKDRAEKYFYVSGDSDQNIAKYDVSTGRQLFG